MEGEEQLAKFMGGPTWQSFALSIWETILLFAISIFLLYFFRERVNMRTPLLALMAGSVYTVYIIHQTIVTWVDTWFIPARPAHVRQIRLRVADIHPAVLLPGLLAS